MSYPSPSIVPPYQPEPQLLRRAHRRTIADEAYRAGGVSIIGGKGKIDINNTFEERLKILEDEALPMVRTKLFGENKNRKFHD